MKEYLPVESVVAAEPWQEQVTLAPWMADVVWASVTVPPIDPGPARAAFWVVVAPAATVTLEMVWVA